MLLWMTNNIAKRLNKTMKNETQKLALHIMHVTLLTQMNVFNQEILFQVLKDFVKLMLN